VKVAIAALAGPMGLPTTTYNQCRCKPEFWRAPGEVCSAAMSYSAAAVPCAYTCGACTACKAVGTEYMATQCTAVADRVCLPVKPTCGVAPLCAHRGLAAGTLAQQMSRPARENRRLHGRRQE
jgi:hypothetical protein